MNERKKEHAGRTDGKAAFTLTELLVVIAVLALLATVTLPGVQRSNAQILRAHCASNLQQIGVALNIYAAEADGYLPICKFRDQNAWYTYEMARMIPGTATLTEGYKNLGLLFRTKAIAQPATLYCPAQTLPAFTYEYYGTISDEWPVSPDANGNGAIRSGFNYFPQLRLTTLVNIGRGSIFLPKVTITTIPLEFGTLTGSALLPARLSEVNPRKSIVTDLVSDVYGLTHRAYGEPVGLNALFPDGTVAFQNARERPEAFDPGIWNEIGSNGINFRRIMNYWEP